MWGAVKTLTDFFGRTVEVGDVIAYAQMNRGGYGRVQLGRVTKVWTEQQYAIVRTWATIERWCASPVYGKPDSLLPHDFDMTSRPFFKAPEGVTL